jgi:hypothetical protein
MGKQQEAKIERRPRRSNARLFRDGDTCDFSPWGEWQERMWKQALWKRYLRWAAFYVGVVAAAWGTAFNPAGAKQASAVIAGLAAGCGIIRVALWREERAHHRDWVRPLDDALPPEATVREVARNRERAVLDLRPGLVADDQFKQLVLLTTAVKLDLPLADLKGDFRQHGKKPQAMITLVPPPPGYVSFGDIRALADQAEEHQVVFGLGRKGAPVIISVDTDSPHLGFSMGSGDGKSVTARNAASQLAHHGALIVVLDTKLISQHWAAGLPNVAYARTPAELHELAIWLAAEIDRRNKIALYHADVEGKVHANPGYRIVGILEELNATQAALTAHHKEEGGKGKSPAVIALDKVAFTGRQVGVNLIYIGQRLSAKAVSGGSGDARENLGVLLMSNPGASTWKMLVGDRHALPPATDVQGRLQIVTAKTVTEVQGAYVTGAQAREYATSGVVAVAPSDMPCVGGLAPVGTAERLAQEVPDIRAIDGHGPDRGGFPENRGFVPGSPAPAPRPVTGPEAVELGILAGFNSWDSAHKALMRDPDGPRPGAGKRGNAPLWDPVELADWNEAKRSLGRAIR